MTVVENTPPVTSIPFSQVTPNALYKVTTGGQFQGNHVILGAVGLVSLEDSNNAIDATKTTLEYVPVNSVTITV